MSYDSGFYTEHPFLNNVFYLSGNSKLSMIFSESPGLLVYSKNHYDFGGFPLFIYL